MSVKPAGYDGAMARRVLELEREGFIEYDPPESRRPGSRLWALTEKGWAALSYAAEAPVKPRKGMS